MSQWVYSFGAGTADGGAEMRDLLGGKGANLAEMSRLGLPVPPGFTITTEVCSHYYAHDRRYPEGLRDQAAAALARLETELEAGFGDPERPLLVSVRSGAPRLDAGHDGHRAQPRPQRPDRAGPRRAAERRALRLRQLSPLHPDVRRRRAGRRSLPASRTSSRTSSGESGYQLDTELCRRRPAAPDRGLPGDRPGADRGALPAGRRRSSSGARSARCSAPG